MGTHTAMKLIDIILHFLHEQIDLTPWLGNLSVCRLDPWLSSWKNYYSSYLALLAAQIATVSIRF